MIKPMMYKIIHEKLKKESVLGEISLREIKYYLGKLYHVQKEDRHKIIKELEAFGIIKLKNGWNIYVVTGCSKPFSRH
jgi:hypothetical protein